MRWAKGNSLIAGLIGFGLLASPCECFISFEGTPIEYSTRQPTDPVAELIARIETGNTELDYEPGRGFLVSLLNHLDIPISSQVLVFSKTSFQAPYISPEKPRALYFNDDIYVGWVQNGEVIEISSVDPEQGAIFYALEQDPASTTVFTRETDSCLQCHASPHTESVPGHLMRSVFTDNNGNPIFNAGTFVISQNTPIREKWGGWYVTGRHGSQRHMGNVCLIDSIDPADLPVDEGANLTRLDLEIDTRPYLTSHSDLVALLVLQHQTVMHNFITQANYQARMALALQKELDEMRGEPTDRMSGSTLKRFSYAAAPLIRHLLFADEIHLEGPVKGTSGFSEDFEKLGPRDSKGRSLRDLDLRTRTFKHPCSYLVYTESFDSLPAPFLEYLYREIWKILTATAGTDDFPNLTMEDRRAVLEILRETKTNLPAYWQ